MTRMTVGLISDSNKQEYRTGNDYLTDWSKNINVYVNVNETKGMIVDFKKSAINIIKSTKINSSIVEMVNLIWFFLYIVI